MHDEEPADELYVPGEHGVADVAHEPETYVPAGAVVHGSPPVAL